jgi:hypothetical protein
LDAGLGNSGADPVAAGPNAAMVNTAKTNVTIRIRFIVIASALHQGCAGIRCTGPP